MSMNVHEQKYQKMVGGISWTSATMVSALALASFSLSFEALRHLAIEQGVVTERLSWIFPLVVDGAIVVFSLTALRASLRKESAMMMRLLVIGVSALSVCFNIAHVKSEWLARVLAATPPVLLFLSVEALLHTVQKEVERGVTKHEKETEGKPLSKEDRRAYVQQCLADGMIAVEIADSMKNVSLRTIQRDIAAVEKNG